MIVWDEINTVLMDMDGTLLDLYFDNHFWQELIPLRYAQQNGMDLVQPRRYYSRVLTQWKARLSGIAWIFGQLN